MRSRLVSSSLRTAACGRILLLIAALISYVHFLFPYSLREPPAHAQAPQAEDAQQARELVSGESVSGDLRSSDSVLFKISVSRERPVRVTVKKKTSTSQLQYSPLTKNRAPSTSAVASECSVSRLSVKPEGTVYLQVKSLEKDSIPRQYVLKIEDVRDATTKDYEAARASLAYSEAEALRAKWDQQSFRSAIAKYSEALIMWERAGDSQEQLQTLKRIGECHFLLSDYRAALDAHMKAVSLSQSLGNMEAELDALNDAGYVHIYLGEKTEGAPILRARIVVYARPGLRSIN